MAVRNYSADFGWRLAGLFVTAQLVGFTALALWANVALERFSIDPLILIGAPLVLIEAVVGYMVIRQATRPIKQISEAISYAYRDSPDSGQETKSLIGLATAIRRLNTQAKSSGNDLQSSFAASLLEHVPLGIVVFNAKQDITYASPNAPMHGGGKELNLNFEQSNSLQSWLGEVQGKAVSSSRWWKRLPEEHIESEENRQFYDAFAVYHQDNTDELETILITINRTDEYGVDEDDLDFTALAAHELRGPITVIRGYLDVLQQELAGKLSSDQQAFFERLDVSADRLSTYINNILNVARYDRHHLQLNLKEENLPRIYHLIAEDLSLRARTLHRVLNVNFPDTLPTIAADRSSLSEAIINLVDNAIKYSSEGGTIVVEAKVQNDFVEVSVKDNGIGIPSALLPHLFSKFYRSHRSRENTVGSGLGLYIVKAVIESHGGEVGVRSEEGHGSTFSFTLPIYATVADKLLKSDNDNQAIITPKKFIKNHSVYRG